MKGKHTRKKRVYRLRIVDKKKFVRAISITILLLLSMVCLVVHGVKVNQAKEIHPIGTIRTTDINLDNPEILKLLKKEQTAKADTTQTVTSRGGEIRTEKNTTESIEKLEQPMVKYVGVKNGINVRESYNENSNKVKALPYTEQVTVTEKTTEWGKIGENQWVKLSYLTDTKPVVEPKVETPKETKPTTQSVPDSTPSDGYIAFTATGYCPCSSCCGKSNGMTGSGVRAQAGVTVAMPSTYPFGTKVEIKGMGTRICQDRGGAIKGNKIDIFFNTHQEALNFGRRTVYLRVIN